MEHNTNQANSTLKSFVTLGRPFTLLAPLIGFLSGAMMAYGANTAEEASFNFGLLVPVLLGGLAAAILNAGSNAINQIYDLPIDRINKPDRPLPTGALTLQQAWWFTVIGYLGAILLSLLVNLSFFVIVLFTAFLTYAYSAPPFRTKRFGVLANVTIAIPRGCLLIVAGWSAVSSPWNSEPWLIGLVMGLFVLGAATTKDYSDIPGDQAFGCITLPVRYGINTSVKMIAPFFVIPFLALGVFAWLGWLSGHQTSLVVLGLLLAVWGGYIAWLLLRHPEALATEANHVSWKHMYLLMLASQLGIAICYLAG